MDILSLKGMALLAAVFCTGMGAWYTGSGMSESKRQQERIRQEDQMREQCSREIERIAGVSDESVKRQKLLELRSKYLLQNPELSAMIDTELLKMLMDTVNKTSIHAAKTRREAAVAAIDVEGQVLKANQKMAVAQELMAAVNEKEARLQTERDSLSVREKVIATREKELAASQEKISSLSMELSLLQEKLNRQSSDLDERMAALVKNEERINASLASLDSRQKSWADNIIIVPQPAAPSVSTSWIVRETVPVYIGNWWHRRPPYIHYNKHHRYPYRIPFGSKSGVDVRVGGGGLKVRVVK